MELIYAFMDESGQWHGEPDAETDGDAPREDTLIYRPLPGMEGALSRFAGQRLLVRYADIFRPVGPVPYQVEGGDSYLPTLAVYDLLTESPSEGRKAQIPKPRSPSTLEGRRGLPNPDPHGP
jgi:hypothetical protein